MADIFSGEIAPVFQILEVIRAVGLSRFDFDGLGVVSLVHKKVNLVAVGVPPEGKGRTVSGIVGTLDELVYHYVLEKSASQIMTRNLRWILDFKQAACKPGIVEVQFRCLYEPFGEIPVIWLKQIDDIISVR